MSQSTDSNMNVVGANSADRVADASAGYFAHSASASQNPVQGGVVCPPGYKQTEVGVIPEDWLIEKLGSIGKFKNGINKSADDFGFGYPFVNLMDVFGKPAIRGDESFGLINSTELDKKEYSLVEGDVLFIRSSVKPSGVGLTTVVMTDLEETVYSGFLIRFRTVDKLVTDFKRHCFYEKSFRGRVISGSTVSANTNINQDALKDIYFVFPSSKREQTAIANALSDVDALISELEKLIAKKQAIKTATMQQLLTGRTRLPQFALREDGSPKGTKPSELGEIPEDWECKSLEELCSLKSGLGITSSDIDNASEYRCFGGNGLRGYTKQFTHEGEYALIGRQGALCGNIQYVNGKFFASEHALVATPLNGIDSRWLAIYLERMDLNQYSESSAQPGLSAEKLRVLNLITPTSKEQTAIATILSDMDAEIQALEQRLGKTRQIKQGMMQELLTGKTRLIKPSKEVIHE
jgi:type I restriction enzyme, S subunit